ncbi:MAG TPA: alanine--tRNA ligase, partial [Hanamia sp.]|nr:alanine--tRNA ligase [Hanamia sp.]
IAAIENISGKKYDYSDSKEAVAFRVIADHIRAIAFPIADGQLPSNTGAGYVIRRILRRAVRYYFSYLNVKEPLLYKLVPLIATQFENVFPELEKQKDFVEKVVFEEETNFLRTLEKGLQRFEVFREFDGYEKLKDGDKEISVLSGAVAFELYDTFGFPLDLTKLVASERGLTVDEAGFEKEMQKQKSRSRAASVVDAEDWVVLNEEEEGNGFVGYENIETESKVVRYRKTKTKGKELFQLVLNTTPFYAESGGQVGDTGVLIFGEEKIPVINTKKESELILHFTEKLPSDISSKVVAKVDVEKRNKTAVHHSATHLMHAALRKVLGTHVQQKGSLVNEGYLRFDFSHFSKMNKEEIEKVEAIVNEKIRENIPVVIRQMPKEEAMKTGAMALFGEKYGDMVRVVTMDENYSIELCGGTHVGNTGELGIFKITTETAVGAGLRRIEAVSGKAAEDFINKELEELNSLKEQLKNPKDSRKALENLLMEKEKLTKQADQLELQILGTVNEQLRKNSVLINGINFIGAMVPVTNADALKKLISFLKEDLENYLIVLCAAIDGKANVVVAADENFISSKNTDAVKIIKEQVAPLIKGGGGGQKTLASAGGQDASKLNQVIENVKSFL